MRLKEFIRSMIIQIFYGISIDFGSEHENLLRRNAVY